MPEKRYNGKLWKKPKVSTIIEGFPGFGLVSTIATGFLIDHLQCEQIGKYWFEGVVQPSLAIHDCKVVDPIGVYYNKKYNIAIIHSVASTTGLEWDLADLILEVAKLLGAKEVLTLEGVGSTDAQNRGFFYTSNPAHRKRFEKIGIDCLGEGIIVGATGSLLVKAPEMGMDVCCLFSETQSNLPDSKAAAKIIELLDQYLGLKVDYKPLLKQAQEFESKLRSMLEQQSKAQEIKEKKDISYVG